MQSPNASDRSRPLIEDRSPSNSTTLPLPLICSPRNLQAFSPYALLSARTTMNAPPLSGRVSTVTTGIFCWLSCEMVLAMAPVSCGAITIALAPCAVMACTLDTSLVMSFCELVGVIRLMPRSLASVGTYLLYEFQKSVSARGKSTPIGPTLPPPPASAESPLLQAASVPASATHTATVRMLRLSIVPRFVLTRRPQAQAVHAAVHREHGAGGRSRQGAGEVADGVCDLVGGNEPPGRL